MLALVTVALCATVAVAGFYAVLRFIPASVTTRTTNWSGSAPASRAGSTASSSHSSW